VDEETTRLDSTFEVGDSFVTLVFDSEGELDTPGAFSLDSFFFLEASVDSE
jgi:hypothetical protein